MTDTTNLDVAALRREYSLASLDENTLLPDPYDQFAQWLQQACTAQLLEPNAMVLSTHGTDGFPDARTVLLKKYDRTGLVFFTNLESKKARQIEADPRVCLVFPWYALERQVTIHGMAEKAGYAETLAYFVTRPLLSRLGAWASPQSKVISSRSLLEMKFEEMKKKFADGDVPVPSFWGGFRVKPERYEFWQGRRSRLHDRFRYEKVGDTWKIERLAP